MKPPRPSKLPPEAPDDFAFERPTWESGGLVAGVDEAGRGCLAGPVVAAAVIMPQNYRIEGVADSKTLSAKRRETLAQSIKNEAICWAVGLCSPMEIDQLNILWASMEAMKRALLKLSEAPDMVLIDGNTSIPDLVFASRTIVKGDALSHSIAAASILAKTHRDEIMMSLHEVHPEFSWITNVGYPTRAHYQAIQTFGITPYHRTTFRLN
jgi:ribonuclease HII